ncbi:MAG: ABC transporter substrate-binding protein [Candidatus Eisenbacteria bacterium]|uniref:ABC transporter substrate-binding protein n=1 Tax=Eiseniibacteriota bacterium TaxID=2212470 RepID=A0A956SEF2_UNCEI|nr:ABC transporter substrate-binding protein [Candidatus Eisenbacteria bacterium]MCB9465601.1 ABC transporter substrate-binding protein [Candidatus Eisenbacteria bacterium]
MNASPRSIVIILGAALLASLVAWGLVGLERGSDPAKARPDGAGSSSGSASSIPARVVSLSPGITEVIEEIGRSEQLVGISDFCAPVAGRTDLPRLGTALTPNYEAILSAAPDLILTQAAHDTPLDELRQLAPVVSLQWHTSRDLVESIHEVGRLLNEEPRGSELARKVESVLFGPQPDDTSPTVLFVLEHSPGQLSEAWYVKDDTIHGDALRAAGARNVIPPGETGAPRLSLERVVVLDPDAILILSTQDSADPGYAESLLQDWRALSTMRAVREEKLAVVTGDRLYVTGPRVVELVDAIRAALVRIGTLNEEPKR